MKKQRAGQGWRYSVLLDALQHVVHDDFSDRPQQHQLPALNLSHGIWQGGRLDDRLKGLRDLVKERVRLFWQVARHGFKFAHRGGVT